MSIFLRTPWGYERDFITIKERRLIFSFAWDVHAFQLGMSQEKKKNWTERKVSLNIQNGEMREVGQRIHNLESVLRSLYIWKETGQSLMLISNAK